MASTSGTPTCQMALRVLASATCATVSAGFGIWSYAFHTLATSIQPQSGIKPPGQEPTPLFDAPLFDQDAPEPVKRDLEVNPDLPSFTWYIIREDFLQNLLESLGVVGVDHVLLGLYQLGLDEDSLVALMLTQD